MEFGGSMTSLSRQTVEAMTAAGLRTFIDVANLSRRDFKRLKGIGPKSTERVRYELLSRGVDFADNARYLESYTKTVASQLSRPSWFDLSDLFQKTILREMRKLQKAGLSLTDVTFDFNDNSGAIMFYKGMEHVRITPSIKVKVTRHS
jgi:hypothetical protein